MKTKNLHLKRWQQVGLGLLVAIILIPTIAIEGKSLLGSFFVAYDYGALDCDVDFPSYGEQFSAGESIYFGGSATQGTYALDYDSAYWESDYDGTFLYGTTGYASLTTPGTHDITFRIQDEMGYYCSYGTSLLIVDGGGTPPSCGISFPTTGSSYAAGEQFNLGGNWYETVYPVSDYWWTSDKEGTILDGVTFAGVSLSQNGTHTITFYVEDNQGQTCSDSISVSISGGSDGDDNDSDDGGSDEYCSAGCPDSWIGDGVCDSDCYTSGCNWDNGDCDADYDDDVNDGYCAIDCPDSWISDGVCDSACYNSSCDWDGGDCDSDDDTDDYCATDCPDSWIDDGVCDSSCYNSACGWDGSDCDDYCNPGCPDSWVADGVCDDTCNVAACNYDAGDCSGDDDDDDDTDDYCATDCPDSWINDDVCDSSCYNEACGWDGSDCDDYCVPGCPNSYLGDGMCDESCNVATCNFDQWDCTDDYDDDDDDDDDGYCATDCPDYWITDGVCDDSCYNAACDWDGGDCDGDGDDDDDNDDSGWCGTYCPTYWVGDDLCQGECNVDACDYDGGDCDGYCDAFCEFDWIGDGTCDDSCNNYFCEYDGGDCGDDDDDDNDDYDPYYDYSCNETYNDIWWEDAEGTYTEEKENCEYGCDGKECYENGYEVTAIYPADGEISDVLEGATVHRYYLLSFDDEASADTSITLYDEDDELYIFHSDDEGILDIEIDASDLNKNNFYDYTITGAGGVSIDPVEFQIFINEANHYKSFSGTFAKQAEASLVVQVEGAEETKRTVTYAPELDQTRVDLNTKYKGGVGISCGESGIKVEAGSAKALVGYECGITGGLFTDEVLGYEIDYAEYQDYISYSNSEKFRAMQLFNLLTLGYAHQISPLLSEVFQDSTEAISGSLESYKYKEGLAIGGYGAAEVDAGIGVAIGGDTTNVGAFAAAGVNAEMAIGANNYPKENKESFTLRGSLGSSGSGSFGVNLTEDVNLGIGSDIWNVTGEGVLERFYNSAGTPIETVLTIAGSDSIYEYKFNGTSGYNSLWEDLHDQGGLSFHSVLYYFLTYASGDPNAIVIYTEYSNIDQEKEDFSLGASGKLLGVGGELGIKLNEDTQTIYVKERRALVGGQEFLLEEYYRPDVVSISMEDLILNSFAVANPEFMEALEETGEIIEAAGETLDSGLETVEDGIMQVGNAALSFFGY